LGDIGYVLRPGGRTAKPQRYRVGESHGRATISDDLVEQIRNHHDAGWGWRRIWQALHANGVRIGKSSVRRICFFEVRSQRPQIVVPADASEQQGPSDCTGGCQVGQPWGPA